MAFSNAEQVRQFRTDSATEDTQHMLTLLHSVGQANVPWIFKPFDGQTTVAASNAFVAAGRDDHSVVVWSRLASPGVAADTAPSAFSLEVWGSHTNDPGSYVKIATISTVGETVVSGEYSYLVFYLASITTPGSGLRVICRSRRKG